MRLGPDWARLAGEGAGPQSRARKPTQVVYASQAIDLITDVRPAADLVGDLAREAESALARISFAG